MGHLWPETGNAVTGKGERGVCTCSYLLGDARMVVRWLQVLGGRT